MKIVAKVLIINSHDELLLLYRGDTHPNFPGHLDLPGGEVEEDEQWSDAAAREVIEETGIKLLPSDLIKAFEIRHPEVIHVLYVSVLKEAVQYINLSWEHTRYKWFAKPDLLQTPLPPNVDRYYRDVIAYLKKSA